MKVSVVVPTMNRPDDVRRMLESLVVQSRQPDEIIIVDQSDSSSTQHLVQMFTSQFPASSWKYLHLTVKSLVRARNYGVHASTGDAICFLDDDVVLDRQYIESTVRVFMARPDVVGVAGNARWWKPEDPRKWVFRKAMMRLFLLSRFNGRMTASGFGSPIYEKAIDSVKEVELLPGYGMSYRSQILKMNPSDEWFSGYGFREDVDLSYRISRFGKLVMIPDAGFEHRFSSTNRLLLPKLREMQIKNYWYVFSKYKRKHWWSVFLFVYSISGFLMLDLLGCFGPNRHKKLTALKATIRGIVILLRELPANTAATGFTSSS